MSGPYFSPVLFPGAVTSGIGQRSSPGGVGSTNHGGIDIAVPTGTGIIAPVDMRITRANWSDSYGNVIYGEDTQGNQYRFAHLSGFNVQQGQTVAAGSLIGASGSTGRSTGPHLHFEVRDKFGRVAKGLANSIVSQGLQRGKDAVKGAIDKFLKTNPATAPFAMGADLLGLNPFGGGDGCGINPICYLEKWLERTGFIQRMAFFIIGAILIIGAIMFFARGEGKALVKGATKFAGA